MSPKPRKKLLRWKVIAKMPEGPPREFISYAAISQHALESVEPFLIQNKIAHSGISVSLAPFEEDSFTLYEGRRAPGG